MIYLDKLNFFFPFEFYLNMWVCFLCLVQCNEKQTYKIIHISGVTPNQSSDRHLRVSHRIDRIDRQCLSSLSSSSTELTSLCIRLVPSLNLLSHMHDTSAMKARWLWSGVCCRINVIHEMNGDYRQVFRTNDQSPVGLDFHWSKQTSTVDLWKCTHFKLFQYDLSLLGWIH